jgi:S-adenosylmethionine hydrolase
MQFVRARVALIVVAFVAAVSLIGCGERSATDQAAKAAAQPTIVFMTDFGTANDAVVVVDPGVGTSRKAIIAKTKKGQYFVLPDNGLITPVTDRDGLEGAHEITNPAWMIGDKISSTFHGRDIFSPTAAHLAAGEDWTLAGPEVSELVRLSPRTATVEPNGITGTVIGLDDPFGSLITDIQGGDFKKLGYDFGDKVTLKIDKKQYTFPFEKTFMGVPVGQPLVYIDSRGRVGIAVNQGDFSKKYHVSPPVPVFVPRKGK